MFSFNKGNNQGLESEQDSSSSEDDIYLHSDNSDSNISIDQSQSTAGQEEVSLYILK